MATFDSAGIFRPPDIKWLTAMREPEPSGMLLVVRLYAPPTNCGAHAYVSTEALVTAYRAFYAVAMLSNTVQRLGMAFVATVSGVNDAHMRQAGKEVQDLIVCMLPPKSCVAVAFGVAVIYPLEGSVLKAANQASKEIIAIQAARGHLPA